MNYKWISTNLVRYHLYLYFQKNNHYISIFLYNCISYYSTSTLKIFLYDVRHSKTVAR